MTTVFQQIGPYRIVRQIGHGGMAVVFLAVDTRTDRQVALKLVQLGTDREAREIVDAERFGAELQKRFSERSAHVPAVHEYSVDEALGYFFVAMEYVDGENLSEVIGRGALSPGRAIEIATELARFLEDAHGFQAVINGRSHQSLLHLDLKPRNVRITTAGQVKVLDFGTAKALSLSRKVTRNDFGSVAYLSPERLETGEVDARADLWALGVVLYEMLRGLPPFRAEDTRRLERLILSRRPAPSLTEHVPAGLQAVVARLLDPVASDRYDSAREIRADLERFTSGLRTMAEEQGWPARAHDDDATRRTRQTGADDAAKTRRTVTVDHEKTHATSRTAAATVAPSVPVPPAPDAHRRTHPASDAGPSGQASRVPSLVRTALLLLAFGLVLNELSVAMAAGSTADAVSTYEFDRLPEAWQEHSRLANRSHLGFGIRALEQALIDRTETLAERVLANYRTPVPTVREAQWAAARDALRRALAVSDESQLHAALRTCEGHLHRINGEAKKARGDLEGSRQDLTEAVVAFREAAELRRRWPDPFLGLSRTFVVGLEDVDQGADALNKAQEQGYQPTDRDLVQLADGYRARGNALVRSARQLTGLPQEQEYLVRAAESYRQAITLYSSTDDFDTAPQQIIRTQQALRQVDTSLAQTSASSRELRPSVDDAESLPLQLQGTAQGAAPWP